jgi:ABC-type branched-subunit amino acid transport system substrate-binding protein
MQRNLFFILAAALMLAACQTTYTGVDPAEPGADLFARAERSYRSGAYRKALADYDAYLAQHPSGLRAPTVLFRQGEIRRIWKDYRAARERYQTLIDTYGGSDLAPRAMVGFLQTLFEEAEYREVIRHADAFLRRPGGVDRPVGIFVVLGDTYMALDSPANAVYFYARANALLSPAKDANLVLRIKAAVQKLSVGEILALSERVTDPSTRGYLLYALGGKEAEEGRYGDAARTFSQFVDAFPNHEHVDDARRRLMALDEGEASAPSGGRVIGCLLPLSGAYERYGKKALRAIELALAQAAPAGDVRLIVKDSGSDEGRARTAVLEMAREGAAAVIGPIVTAEAAAAEAQAARVPIVLLTQKPDVTQIGDYVFRNFMTPRMQARSLVSYAVQMHAARGFAILYPQEKYGTVFHEIFRSEVAAQGGMLVAAQSYPVHQSDFSGPIKRLLATGGIDALFIPDGPDNAGLIIPQLKYHGLPDALLLGTNLWNDAKLIRAAGRFAQGAVFPEIFYPESTSPGVQHFVQEYTAYYNEAPGFIDALAYDTTWMVVESSRMAGGGGRPAVRDALHRLEFLQGATGATTFDANGEAMKQLELLTISGDHFEGVGAW